MTPKTEISLLRSFLESKGWTLQVDGPKFIKYQAPESLGFNLPYLVSIPANPAFADYDQILTKVVSNVAELYSLSIDDVFNALSSLDTVFTVRLIGENSKDGTLPLLDFENIMKSLLEAIENTGNFVISNSPIIEQKFPSVDLFLNSCRFLQTEKGSFVVKFQLPAGLFLKEPDLFDLEGVKSDQVGDRLCGLLEFVSSRVLTNDPDIRDQDFISESFQLLSVDTFRNFESLFSKARVDKIEFRFLKHDFEKAILVEDFQTKKLSNLKNYVAYLEDSILETVPIDSFGKITEMKSKNPEGNRNFIIVSGMIEGESKKIGVCLNNSDYQSAINAHKNNLDVNVRGVAKKMKTMYRIITLSNFIVNG